LLPISYFIEIKIFTNNDYCGFTSALHKQTAAFQSLGSRPTQTCNPKPKKLFAIAFSQNFV